MKPMCLVVGRRLVREVGLMICSGYKECLENRSCVGAAGQLKASDKKSMQLASALRLYLGRVYTP